MLKKLVHYTRPNLNKSITFCSIQQKGNDMYTLVSHFISCVNYITVNDYQVFLGIV